MESIINVALRKHLFGFNLISSKQYGFRPRSSTIDLLTATTQRWTYALHDLKEVRLIALDISRAYDGIWHRGLLSKLESVGIKGSLLAWISDFLHGRSQRVVINGRSSSVGQINAGVPQGSVISPTLFLVFIDDLNGTVENELEMFADDTTLHKVVRTDADRENVAASLQRDLNLIETWARQWLVTYNAKKTEVLTISKKKSFRPSCWHPPLVPDLLTHPTLFFFGKPLKEVASIKLLGVTLTESLEWGPQVDEVTKKGNKATNILRRARHFVGPVGLSTLFKAFVRSRMEYGSPLWIGAPGLNQLDLIQRRCCRLMGYPHQNSVKEMNVQTLQHRRLVSGLCMFFRMWAEIAPPDVTTLLPPLTGGRQSKRKDQVPQRTVPLSRSSGGKYHQLSFVPFFTRLWNKLPPSCLINLGRDPMTKFKKNINCLNLEKLSLFV
eukprot:Lithocolla_globosa_v1_NODE_2393_length_2024_cov_88.494667.p1 type:complete len:439 gc:universal NODE_2393_length_2024_cov_88.494667:1444-128(-)